MRVAKHKFGVAGTSCAGKTTLAYGIVARLKSYGVLADGVFSQDRKFGFDKAHLGVTEIAQHWMVTNLISKEIEMSLHGDVDVLITDRTAFDLYGYYAYQYPGSKKGLALRTYVQEWCTTYERIYFLDPLPYQADGKRPNESFVAGVHNVLENLAETIPNVVRLDRTQVLNDILVTAEIPKPQMKTRLEPKDAQHLANTLGRPVVLKDASNADTLSDNDIWIIVPACEALSDSYIEKTARYVRGVFGPFCLIDVHMAASTETFDRRFKEYRPQ